MTDFYTHPKMRDGFMGRCKDCTRLDRRMGHEAGKVLAQWVKMDLSGCWQWQLKINKRTGYGCKTWGGRTLLAHRWMYEIFNGPIPKGLVLDHVCRNRACVNPMHLEPVTQSENCKRGIAARRGPVVVSQMSKSLC